MENKIPTFDELVNLAPEELKEILDKNSKTQQSPNWHPEGDVLKHIRIVYKRAKEFGDLDQAIAAFFHDLGKEKVTRPSKKTEGSWTAYGHELESTRLVERYKDWIESLGGKYDKIHELVKFHMKIKLMGNMRATKQQEMKDNPYYGDLLIFTKFDDMQNLSKEELEY